MYSYMYLFTSCLLLPQVCLSLLPAPVTPLLHHYAHVQKPGESQTYCNPTMNQCYLNTPKYTCTVYMRMSRWLLTPPVDYHCVFVSMFTTAPCDNKLLTQPVWPNLQAICRGVTPWSFLQHTCGNSETWSNLSHFQVTIIVIIIIHNYYCTKGRFTIWYSSSIALCSVMSVILWTSWVNVTQCNATLE